jgi:single-strand DNA-binding protein
MTKSYNNVTLIGRIVKQPELIDVGNDNKRATLTLAVDRPYKDSDGKHPTDFLNVVAWGKLAEICADYCTKGSLTMIAGRIQSRAYTVDDETKWITEIVAESCNVLEYERKKESNRVVNSNAELFGED